MRATGLGNHPSLVGTSPIVLHERIHLLPKTFQRRKEQQAFPFYGRGGGGSVTPTRVREAAGHTPAVCGPPGPPLTASPAPPAHGPTAHYLPLHDGLQQRQHRMPGLGGPLRLQQVRDGLPERFHCMLPPAKNSGEGMLAPSTRGSAPRANDRAGRFFLELPPQSPPLPLPLWTRHSPHDPEPDEGNDSKLLQTHAGPGYRPGGSGPGELSWLPRRGWPGVPLGGWLRLREESH